MLKSILRKDALHILVDWLIGNVEYILIRAAPILAPIPSAFALSHALEKAGWVYHNEVGVIIESIGVAGGVMIAFISIFNQKFPGYAINEKYGYGVFGFYVLLAALLIGGYETLPVAVDVWIGMATASDLVKSFVPLLFPGLTLIGAVIIGLRDYMRRIEEEAARVQNRVDEEKDARQRKVDAEFDLDLDIKRREAEQRLELQRLQAEQKMAIERQKAAAKLSTVNRKPVDSFVNQEPEAERQPEPPTAGEQPVDMVDRLLEVYRRNPKTSLRKAGDIVGLSHAGVDKALDRLEAAGRIHRNGGGVEVRD